MNDAGELLNVVAASDDATVQVVRDHNERRYSAICSKHGRFYSFCYTPAGTRDDHRQFIADTNLAAAKHAAEHTQPRTATEGDQP